MIETRRGTVIVVSGKAGSGKSALLREIARSLASLSDTPTILGGELVLSDGPGAASYLPWDSGSRFVASSHTLEAVDKLIALGGAAMPLMGLVAQLLNATAATWAALDHSMPDSYIDVDLLPRLLRQAASAGPHAVLIDDADLGGVVIWRQLLLGFAAQIARDLPLLLVVSIHDEHADPGHESSAQHGARLLAEQGLGEILGLGSYSQLDVEEWLGPASYEVVKHLTDASSGRADVLGGLWREWLETGTVGRAPFDGRWVFTDLSDSYVTGPVMDSFLKDLERIPGSDELLQEYKLVLGYAALEGRSFTVEVVAHAMERDTEWVVSLLETMTEQAPLGSVLVEKLAGGNGSAVGTRSVRRYRFPSLLHWLCMFRYGFSEPMRARAAASVADGLKRAYSPALWLVAQQLSRLNNEAGRTAQAYRYRRLADFGGSPDVVLEQAQLLVSYSGTPMADAWELQRAGEALIDVIRDPSMGIASSTELEICREAYRLATLGEIPALQIHSLIPMGFAELALGHLESAKTHFTESLTLADIHSHRVCSGRSLLGLGYVAEDTGEREQAAALYLRALSHARIHGLPRVLQECHEALMGLRYREGAIEAARAEVDAWLKVTRGQHSNSQMITMACRAMMILLECGSRERVHALYRQILELRREHDELFPSRVCGYLSMVAVRIGDGSTAWELGELALERALPGSERREAENLMQYLGGPQYQSVRLSGASDSGTGAAKTVRFLM
jgi:hypothetical protein